MTNKAATEPDDNLVLVVEDTKIAQKMVVMALTSKGITTHTADTGTEAITMYLNNKYKLILLDIGLPDIDGFEVATRISSLNSGHKINSRIIALTAHKDVTIINRAMAIGMDGVLSKPITYNDIEEIINRYF